MVTTLRPVHRRIYIKWYVLYINSGVQIQLKVPAINWFGNRTLRHTTLFKSGLLESSNVFNEKKPLQCMPKSTVPCFIYNTRLQMHWYYKMQPNLRWFSSHVILISDPPSFFFISVNVWTQNIINYLTLSKGHAFILIWTRQQTWMCSTAWTYTCVIVLIAIKCISKKWLIYRRRDKY